MRRVCIGASSAPFATVELWVRALRSWATADVSRLTLFVATLFWALASVHRTLTYTLTTALVPGLPLAPAPARLLNHALLLLPFCAAMLMAGRLHTARTPLPRAISLHLAMFTGFSLLARPTFVLSWAWIAGFPMEPKPWYLGIWTSNPTAQLVPALDMGFNYLFGLALLLTVLSLRESVIATAAASEARLDALKAALQPHFLFNALNAAAGRIDADPRGARRVLADLGDLLRMSIEHLRRPRVSVREELALTRACLSVAQARWGEALSWRIDVEPGLETAVVPAMLLQPLIENALAHGRDDDRANLQIEVDVRRETFDRDAAPAARLVMQVRNQTNGRLDHGRRAGGGIGLASLRERLETMLPAGGASLEHGAVDDCSYLARVRVPIEWPADADARPCGHPR